MTRTIYTGQCPVCGTKIEPSESPYCEECEKLIIIKI